ncbi:uncharacterized protein LOC116996878 [Catharus ustulatus]|uniref:uncharacterized protein LOC116996878 n=1 Tax=Catharus ustulatus TaxID=91951 RepID=UPI0014087AD7|nr:uncharacterized protein LOC116996878 [Catharus ustulatus]
MSSHQRKRPGGAADSRPAWKRSRLQPSSKGGTSQTELVDFEQSGSPALEPAARQLIDLISESSVPEVTIIISDDESPMDREQSQQQPHLSRASEKSAEPQERADEEEPREDDGEAEDSAALWASENEEEARDDNSARTENVLSPLHCEDDNPEDLEDSQPYPLGSRAAEKADEVPANENGEEPQDIELRPSGSLLCVICKSCYTQLHEVYERRRTNATLDRCQQVDGSGNGTGANYAPVADSGPAEQGAAEEGTARSHAQQGVVIRCPICMDFYSEIVQSGRLIVATMCGHLFCSGCLPVALETVGVCPTCRMELTPDLYFPIYI